MDFRILGPLEIVDRGGEIPLGGSKQRALLVLLLLHANETLTADRLIDGLWGDHPPASAAKTLQVHISRLRKALDGGASAQPLLTRDHGYELAVDPERIDSHRFERLVAEARGALAAGDAEGALSLLEDALSMWRGPPLADLAYESFVQSEIGRLDELRVAAREQLIDAKLALGRHAELLGEIEAVIAESPYREHPHEQLMLALYRCGRQAEALQAYQDARNLLAEDLGLEPGPGLRDLEGAILRQDPALGIAAAGGAPQTRAAESRLSAPALVGREEEVAQLRDGLGETLRGRGGVFMIGGPAGIGKSRLADQLARDARECGADVLWGRCWEAGGAPAYWPWVQVLRSLAHEREEPSAGSLRGVGAAALVELVPELRTPAMELPSAHVDTEGARFQLFDTVAALLRDSAEAGPIVIVLDDLQAADTPSLVLLQFVAGQLARSPLLLAALYRDDGLSDARPLSSCLAAIAREPATRRIRLDGLTVAGTAALIESITRRSVAADVAARIRAETDGNPLFVGEIVRLLSAEGRLEASEGTLEGPAPLPDTVTEVIEQRLGRLGPECRRLLSTASILGREFGLKELAAISDVDERTALAALDEAFAGRVLTEVGPVDRVRFSHALVRETLYAALRPAERREAHGRAAEALESLHASNPEPHLAELAYHFIEALPGGDPARAVEYARRAGDRARQLLAYEEAIRLYVLGLRALELGGGATHRDRCALLLALGDARARAGDEDAARATFLEAAAIAKDRSLPEELARAALGYGGRFVWARAYDDVHVIPLLEQALTTLPGEASALRVRLMGRLSGALRDHRSRERRASLSAQAVDIARGLGDPATLAYVLDGRCSALLWPENPEERLAIANEIVDLSEQVSDTERAIQGRIYRVLAQLELGLMVDAEAELDTMTEGAAALRQPAQQWFAAAVRAVMALFRGRFEDAETLIDRALALGERAQRRDAVLSHRLQTFLLRRETGRLADVEQAVQNAVSEFPMRPVFRCALACLHADLLHGDTARQLLLDLAPDDFAAIQRDNEYLFSLGFLADAASRSGESQVAAVLYDLLAPYSRLNAANGDELATGSVSRPLGVLAAALGRWDEAAAHFDTALVHNSAMGARPWVAHSRHDYAGMLLARDGAGDRDRARALLGAARDEYRALGMEPWAEAAGELLGSA